MVSKRSAEVENEAEDFFNKVLFSKKQKKKYHIISISKND